MRWPGCCAHSCAGDVAEVQRRLLAEGEAATLALLLSALERSVAHEPAVTQLCGVLEAVACAGAAAIANRRARSSSLARIAAADEETVRTRVVPLALAVLRTHSALEQPVARAAAVLWNVVQSESGACCPVFSLH